MRDLELKLSALLLFIVVFVGILGVAGDFDLCEQVVLRMSSEDYDLVKDTLRKLHGSEPSERDIAHWWLEHHEGAR